MSDDAGLSTSDEQERKSGRVYQKTVSLSPEEVQDLKAGLADSEQQEPEVPEHQEEPLAEPPEPEPETVYEPEPVAEPTYAEETFETHPEEEVERSVEEPSEGGFRLGGKPKDSVVELSDVPEALPSETEPREDTTVEPEIEEAPMDMQDDAEGTENAADSEEQVVADEQPRRERSRKRRRGGRDRGRKDSRPSGEEESVDENLVEGELVGWFVNYERDSKGIATELRSGRFMVTQERLRSTDMLIRHDTVSTPHCMVKALSGQGIELQDLMSENGTWLKRDGESNFHKHTDPVMVGNGDIVRFGSYEVLICLVPKSK
jgi:hypothetical protein